MLNRVDANFQPFAVNNSSGYRFAFGTTTDTDDIDANYNSNILIGWGTTPNEFPEVEDFNALAYTSTYLSAYLYQMGIAEWNENQEYYIHSRSMGSDGNIYKSLSGTDGSPNVGNDPVTDGGTNWEEDSLALNIPSFTAKTTPVNADLLVLSDSEDSNDNKKITFEDLKNEIVLGVSSGAVLQTAYSELTTSGTTTATIPYDTSIPQQTEGAEILTCSITPTREDSNLLITVRTYISEVTNTGESVVAALFRDSGLDALAVGAVSEDESNIASGSTSIQVRVPSNSTTATTFKLRVGNDVGSCRWNGYMATQYYGASNLTSIHVQEEL